MRKGCWIVDPEGKAVEVHMLGERGFELDRKYGETEILGFPIFLGLEIPLREMFVELRNS